VSNPQPQLLFQEVGNPFLFKELLHFKKRGNSFTHFQWILTFDWFQSSMATIDDKNIHRPNGRLFKLSCTHKLQRQKGFESTQKSIQTMTTTRLNLIINTKHENQRQWYKVCKTKIKTKFYFDNIWKLEYEMKWIYGAKSYIKLMLNKLKVMVGPISIYIPLRT